MKRNSLAKLEQSVNGRRSLGPQRELLVSLDLINSFHNRASRQAELRLFEQMEPFIGVRFVIPFPRCHGLIIEECNELVALPFAPSGREINDCAESNKLKLG